MAHLIEGIEEVHHKHISLFVCCYNIGYVGNKLYSLRLACPISSKPMLKWARMLLLSLCFMMADAIIICSIILQHIHVREMGL